MSCTAWCTVETTSCLEVVFDGADGYVVLNTASETKSYFTCVAADVVSFIESLL